MPVDEHESWEEVSSTLTRRELRARRAALEEGAPAGDERAAEHEAPPEEQAGHDVPAADAPVDEQPAEHPDEPP
ncbi:MAG: hypothetical protein HGA44_16565, partial [Cellulomonadaceae bacterium]|nr:hypothetical protein [Cellulomonadaceae bacterium]